MACARIDICVPHVFLFFAPTAMEHWRCVIPGAKIFRRSRTWINAFLCDGVRLNLAFVPMCL